MAERGDQTGQNDKGGAAGFLADDRGATAIEYALIAGFLSIAIAAVVSEIGTTVAAFFTTAKGFF